jgi:hypothetical protein
MQAPDSTNSDREPVMTKKRFGRSANRAAIEDEALAQIAGRPPQPPARRPGWLEIVGVWLWICVLTMVTVTITVLV